MAVRTGAGSVAERFPAKHLARPEVRALPEPPASTWRIIGPGVIAAGVGLASGEFILFPYIASQVGLVFVWAALVGLVTQFFLNMEIERYTLATGETALTGFSRFWRHWGLVFAILTFLANLWPGWVTSSATLVTYLWGGSVRWIALGMLIVIGLVLTLAPVVYTALERTEMLKVAAVLVLLVVGTIFAISADTWQNLPTMITDASVPVEALGFPLLLGALAFAGAGGGQNLVQSNWIRDKRFGMGAYVPRIVSPLTGKPEAAPSTGFIFEPTDENLSRWQRWWRLANREQLYTFVLITFLSIMFTSLLAYSTVFGRDDVPNAIGFLKVEGEQLSLSVGGWFGPFFWFIGAFALFAAALGIVDYTSRLTADVIKTSYAPRLKESTLYFGLVWGLVLLGCVILLAGFVQPLVLLVISACVGGVMMCIYSALLILLNRRVLTAPIRIRAGRIAVLGWSVLLFGVLSVLTIIDQGAKLFGG
ncbi:Nramp family divalent metal transporter [Actinophytocola sp.]|uniref:Nramp family divalent metal transporter n=1 Tax=Actinophytocola sp. TaxID=1872138 RepID=UPI002D7EB274|nr:Nramp family divalent metal transporter [Actinophytocola sp.]HET9139508.1 Nramp family divalent metal transporter [Actinophytocola sp.]HEU5111621.1 Nramp family divalent metal transporter [Micromonosporaceae bacterium]